MRQTNRRHAGSILERRDEILAYLREHSRGQQGQIASEVGVRREAICYYANGRELNDVRVLARLEDWMRRHERAC